MEKGQLVLIDDLNVLMAEAIAGEFGDFSNEKYVAPKVELYKQLLALSENVLKGKYD